MEIYEIKHCPFCNGESSLNTTRTSDKKTIELNGTDTFYGVNCIDCGANNNSLGMGYKTKREAVEHWNKRI